MRDIETVATATYDRGWQSQWDDMKKYGPFSRHLRRMIKQIVRPLEFQSVLDIGCGQGSLLQELQTEFPKIIPYGIDISVSAVELARGRVSGGRFRVMDITEGSLDEKYDLVVCSEVLEHIPDDLAALQNLRKMTQKYLLVSAPQGRMRGFEKQYGHVRNYAHGELVRKLEKQGFVILSVLEWGFPFYSPLYRDFLQVIGSKGTTGEFGSVRKLMSQAIYFLFLLNSSRRGDQIVVLAQPVDNC